MMDHQLSPETMGQIRRFLSCLNDDSRAANAMKTFGGFMAGDFPTHLPCGSFPCCVTHTVRCCPVQCGFRLQRIAGFGSN
jgi:hypothetical protein